MHLFIIMLIHQESRSFTFGGFLCHNPVEKDTSTWNHPAQTSFHLVWPFLTTQNSAPRSQIFSFQSSASLGNGFFWWVFRLLVCFGFSFLVLFCAGRASHRRTGFWLVIKGRRPLLGHGFLFFLLFIW